MARKMGMRSLILATLAAVFLVSCPMPVETPLLQSVKETVDSATRIPSPPVVTVASPTNDTTPAWSWTIPVGAVDIRYQLDVETAAGWTVVGGTGVSSFTPLAALPEGDHTLHVQAGNRAGGWSASGSATVTIDITAPAAPVVSGASPTNDTTPTWSWTVTVEVIAIRYQVDSESSGGWSEAGTSVTSYTPAADLADATYTLYVQAKDAAGNWSTSGSRAITVDRNAATPPVVTGTSPTNDTTPTWSWTIPTGAVDIRYQLDSETGVWTEVGGVGVTSYTPSSALTEGSHTLYVQSRNVLPTWSASGSLTILIDITVPTATVQINAGAQYTNTLGVSVSLTASDGVGSGVQQMMLSNDAGFAGASWETLSSPRAWTLATGDGLKTVYVKVRDAAGNDSATSMPSITLDTQSPAAPSAPDLAAADDTGSSSTDNITKNTTALTFSGSGAEANATVALYSDKDGSRGSTTASGGGTWSIDATLSENTHLITARVVDAAGNQSAPSSALTVVVDVTAVAPVPDLDPADDTGSSSTDNITKNMTGLTFLGSGAEANSSLTLSSDKDGSLLSTTVAGGGTWTLDVSLSANTHAITAVLTDVAGNVSNPSGALTVVVDTTTPAPSILTPFQGQNTGNNKQPTFRWTAPESGCTYDVQADNNSDFLTPELTASTAAGVTSYTPTSAMTVSAGPPVGTRYYIRARATDVAGNTSGWSNSGYTRYVNVGRYDSDFNGDGWSDAVVGAPYNDTVADRAGAAYVYFGGSTMDTTADVTMTGAAIYDQFGHGVASAGDVNGDGYADVIVGAHANGAGGVGAGAVYVYFGGNTMDNTADVTITGAVVNEMFGWTVASAGDVNGDGYSDVMVGTPVSPGSVYVYLGGNPMNTVADVTMTGGAGDYLGSSCSSAGDVNGDGYTDVIAGAASNDAGGTNAGRAYVYLGGSSMNNVADITMTGAAANDYLGCWVASAGDVNGDGYADVIVGAYGNDTGGADAGAAYVYLGASSMDDVADVTMTGATAGDWFGYRVASAGDVNGDGYSDVIVGVPRNDAGGTDAGRAYVYQGGSAMNNVVDVTMTGAAAGDNFGFSVASAGDVNGDGYADVIVGAYYNDLAFANAGAAYVYQGGSSMNNVADVTMTGAAADDWLGYSVY